MKPAAPPIDPKKRSFVVPEPELSGRHAKIIVRVFAVLLVAPLIFEIAGWCGLARSNLLAGTIRSGTQWLLLHALNEGNRDVHAGHDGWLCEQRDINRIVRTNRVRNDLHGCLTRLAAELKKQDSRLLVITIPSRVAMYPEQVQPGEYTRPVRLKEEDSKLAELAAAGAEVMDMADALWEFRERQAVYYAQDSHWTPEAMKAVALAVNKQVREKFPRLASTETPIINATILEHDDAGDLARRLDPLHPANLLGEEPADLISIRGLEPDAASSIVLHGGELMRVFDDASLSFGGGGRPPHAGFATQLATLLGKPLDVRGMPHDGESYEGKKLVICLLPMAELAP